MKNLVGPTSLTRRIARRSAPFWPIPAAVVFMWLLTPWLTGRPCPKQLTMASGPPSGAYHAFAKRYRAMLVKQGIQLTVVDSAGSVHNRRVLKDRKSGIELAIVQGGVCDSKQDTRLRSLTSLYLEPIWVFYRDRRILDDLGQLKGKRISLGIEGSGTRQIAVRLLEENLVGTQHDRQTRLLALPDLAAAQQLRNGGIDAAFFVISPTSDIVQQLLNDPQLKLMSFRRATAYTARFPFLSKVQLAEGLVDLRRNIPNRDITLLAPAANLVGLEDLHPALVSLLLETVTEVHEQAGLLHEADAFPTARYVDLPLHDAARRFFRSGPTFLFRWLPFPLAAWLDQVKLLLLPLFTLIFPLLRFAPSLYRWRIRSRIYRWYRVLHSIDQRLQNEERILHFGNELIRLKTLEEELRAVQVPLSYMEEFYNLRVHIAFVRKKLDRRRTATPRRAA